MSRPLFDCLSCNRFVPSMKNHTEKSGTCRGRPPLPQVIGMQPGALGPQPMTISVWPTVGKGDWCDKHPMFERFLGREIEAFDLSRFEVAPSAIPLNGGDDPAAHNSVSGDAPSGEEEYPDPLALI